MGLAVIHCFFIARSRQKKKEGYLIGGFSLCVLLSSDRVSESSLGGLEDDEAFVLFLCVVLA